jgi:hypothetical protein
MRQHFRPGSARASVGTPPVVRAAARLQENRMATHADTPRHGPRTLLSALLLSGLCLTAFPLRGADADGDGLDDDLEAVLGTDPRVAEEFASILERSPPARVTDRARALVGVAMANAGQDRFVWRIDFAAEYPQANSNVVFYLDADNNPKTGRAEHGCEVMLIVTEGACSVSAFRPDGSSAVAPVPRAAIWANHLYIAYDVGLPQQDGQSLLRLMVLSETWRPHQGVDSVSYFNARGPGVSTRSKLRLDSDITESIGMLQTYGPRTIDPIVTAPSTLRLPVFGCTLEGFRFQPSEYRADSVVRTGMPARIVATAPTTGSFFPGFVLHDAAGREVLGVTINGQRQGVAVADWDDNDQRLFFTEAAVDIRQGDTIEVRSLSGEGPCRIEDLVLLRERPQPRPAVCEIRHLEATEDRLTWITTWPATCTIHLGDGRSLAENGRWNNHRVAVPALKPGQAIRYRVTATSRDGKAVDSGWRDYTWAAPGELPTPTAGSVPLQITPPEGVTLANWPVTGGVPFPKGVLGSASHLQLVDDGGRQLPVQAATTARWQDGSVKWALLDFRHSGPAARYELRYGPAAAASADSATPPAAGPSPTCGRLCLVDADGSEFTVELGGLTCEEAGTIRQAFVAAGALSAPDGKAKFAYEVRAHRYPGTPWTRVLLTVGNDVPDSEFTTIESLRWELPLSAPARLFVRQHTDDRYTTSTGEGKRWNGPLGAVHVRDLWQNYPLAVETGPEGTCVWLLPKLRADEYDWAKGTVDEHRLFYWFDPLPARGTGGYTLRQGMTKTHEVWLGAAGAVPLLDRPLLPVCPPAWYANSMALGEFGVADPDREVVRDYDAKVAEAFGVYLKAREDNREYGQFNFGDWWGEREINWGNIEYDTQHAFFLQFARSGDLRFFQAGEEAERHNRDIDTVHYHRDPLRVGRVYAHCIGHVGDYLTKSPLEGPNRGTARGGFTASHTWCEGHSDHYVLTGDRRSQNTARKIADYYGSYGTVTYDFHNCREPGWDLIFTLAVYRGTGDPFYLNAARIIVERVLERQTEEAALGSAGGGWRRRMVPGHCLCEPAHYGNAGFMVGVLLTGLRWYHLETGDARVARSIHLGARFLIADMWVPEVRGFRYTSCPKSSAGPWSNLLLFDGLGYAYRLTGDKDLARILAQGTDAAIEGLSGWGKSYTMYIRVAPHVLGLLAELRETPPLPLPRLHVDAPAPLSGRATVRFAATGSRAAPGTNPHFAWDFGDGATGAGPRVEHSYAAAGRYQATLTVTAGNDAEKAVARVTVPPREVLTADPGRAVLIEAEGFSGQGGGSVKVPEGRKGASGAVVTAWQESLGHWLEWKAEVPATGKYRLILKYCSDSPAPRRELLVDGASPAEACRVIPFERTGGFSTGSDDWRYLTLGGEAQPVALELSAGEHVFRLANLGDGLALDWLLLVLDQP